LCLREETRVDHLQQRSVRDNRRHHPSVIQAFDVGFHAAALP
jgi:hypothetical protein